MAKEETAAICGKEKRFETENTKPLVFQCRRVPGHIGEHSAPNIDPAVEDVTWFDGSCGARAPGPIPTNELTPCCLLERGHFGAHSNGNGKTWSARPPLGPVPERFRQRPAGVSVDPDSTAEVRLAGLVACGRALGRIDHELGQRKHWQAVLSTAARMLPPDRQTIPREHDWCRVGEYLFGLVTAVAEAPQSEPDGPIRERAEALSVLLLQGSRFTATPNVLIRAGVVLDVVRSAWRKAMAGQS